MNRILTVAFEALGLLYVAFLSSVSFVSFSVYILISALVQSVPPV